MQFTHDVQGSVKSALTVRLSDPEAIVLAALYEQPTQLLDLIPTNDYILAMAPILRSGDLNADLLEQHVKFLSSLQSGSVDVLELLFPYMLASRSTFKHAEMIWMGISPLIVSVAPELKKLWTESFQGGRPQKQDMASFNGELAKHLARMCRYTLLTSLTHALGHYLSESRLEAGLNFLVEQFGTPSRVSQALSLLVVHSLVIGADGVNLLKIATSVLNALEDTNMEALGSAVGTNVEEVGYFSRVLPSGLNDVCARHSNWVNFSGSALPTPVKSPRYVC